MDELYSRTTVLLTETTVPFSCCVHLCFVASSGLMLPAPAVGLRLVELIDSNSSLHMHLYVREVVPLWDIRQCRRDTSWVERYGNC